MTIFNPQVQGTSDPNYTNVSKPISDIQADKSTGLLLNSLGDSVEGAAKLTDNLIKESAKEDVRAAVEPIRDAYTAALVRVRDEQVNGGATPQTLAQAGVPANTGQAIPGGLQAGLDQATAIGTAQAQSGGGIKANDTLYTAALNAKAKELRARYPGHVDYIDAQIQSVTGMDPANAFYKNLLQDINQQAAANKSSQSRTVGMLEGGIKEGMPGADKMKALYQSGRLTEEQVDGWFIQQKSFDYNLDRKAKLRASNQGDRQDKVQQAGTDLATSTAELANNNWTTMTIMNGTDTPQKLQDFLNLHAGKRDVPDVQNRAVGNQLVALRNATYNQMWDKATTGGANSMLAQMGGDTDAVKKSINNSLGKFDLAIDAVFKQDYGAAYNHMNMNKAIAADTTDHLFNNPDPAVRNYTRMVKTLDEISPQSSSTFFRDAISKDVPQKLKAMVQTDQLSMMTQPFSGEGKITSLNSVIQKAKDQGIQSPKVFSEYVKLSSRIGDPKTGEQEKLNLAHGFFSPEANGDVLKQFWRDTTDAKGRQVPGQYSVFTQLSSPSVAQGIKQLGQKYPGVINDYKATMERNFSEQLFSSEIRDLSDVSANKHWQLKFNDGKAGGTPHFELLNKDGSPLSGLQATELNAPYRAINRLNQGISGLANVYSVTGGDVPGQILRTLYNSGYKPAPTVNNSPTNYIPIEDIPGKFWKSITGAQQDQLNDMGNMRK